jgi:hypothetical protein
VYCISYDLYRKPVEELSFYLSPKFSEISKKSINKTYTLEESNRPPYIKPLKNR